MRGRLARRAAAGGLTAVAVAVVTVVTASTLARSGASAPPGPGSVSVTVLAVTVALWPEYAPRPRRAFDRLQAVTLRVGLAIGALGFAGFLGIGLVPAPMLLVLVGATAVIVVPILLAWLRRVARPQHVVLAGDDAGKLGDSVAALETRPLGHVSPPRLSLASAAPDSLDVDRLRTDGGRPGEEQDAADAPEAGTASDGGAEVDADGEPEAGAGQNADVELDADTEQNADVELDTGARQNANVEPEGRTDRDTAVEPEANRHQESSAERAERTPGSADRVTDRRADERSGTEGARAERDRRDGDVGRRVPSIESAGGTAVDRPTTERISGLSELQTLLVSRDVDVAVLGFSASDRQEFFGALRVCREQGVDAKVHAFHGPATLIEEGPVDARDGVSAAGAGNYGPGEGHPSDADVTAVESVDEHPSRRRTSRKPSHQLPPDQQILDANVEPLPLHSRAAKRGFDVCFALLGLVALAPLVLVISAAIKLDSPGPVLYGQSRTARLGRVFTLWKFRSMTDGAERESGPTLSDEDAGDDDARVTRVGRVLRATHLDEIPQLLSVLSGDMTVVGPRPERPELEAQISDDGIEWERRWFVKPGLTGLAQINDVTGFQPAEKLAYDLEYVERQSLALDVRIVLEQLRQVVADALALLHSGEER